MDNDTLVKAQSREETGTGKARRLRRAGWVPAVINDIDGTARAIQVNQHDFQLLLQHHSGESLLLDVGIDAEAPRTTILKDVQHDPVSGKVMHADFKEIRMTEKLQVTIPVELTGEAAGVKLGGVLDHAIRELEVECLPGDIVETIEVDVSELAIGDSILVGDLNVDPTLTILTSHTVAVAAVAAPRLEEDAAETAEEAAAGGEPEVIGETKDEGQQSEH